MSHINLLYPLSDILKMDLTYKHVTKSIIGSHQFKAALPKQYNLKLDVEVVSSFFNVAMAQSGVLIHVKGYLYALMVYNGKTRTTTLFLVSSQKLGWKRIDMVGCLQPNTTIKEAVSLFAVGVQRGWAKKETSPDWKGVKLPKEMLRDVETLDGGKAESRNGGARADT